MTVSADLASLLDKAWENKPLADVLDEDDRDGRTARFLWLTATAAD